ncbi:hypothetical protein [Desulfitobacterium sp. THU1]|uniref:hypothetical protein n=1 Tax=Desulfitobacterium sp. THU1 TaxID=3138072 RepID=UPI00311D8A34
MFFGGVFPLLVGVGPLPHPHGKCILKRAEQSSAPTIWVGVNLLSDEQYIWYQSSKRNSQNIHKILLIRLVKMHTDE